MEQNKVTFCGTKLKSLLWNKIYEFAMEQMVEIWYGAMHCSTKFLINELNFFTKKHLQ